MLQRFAVEVLQELRRILSAAAHMAALLALRISHSWPGQQSPQDQMDEACLRHGAAAPQLLGSGCHHDDQQVAAITARACNQQSQQQKAHLAVELATWYQAVGQAAWQPA